MSPIKPSQQIAKLHVGTNPSDAYMQLVQILSQNGDMLAQTQIKESFVEQDRTPHTVYTHVFTPTRSFLQFANGSLVHFSTEDTVPLWKHSPIVEGTLVQEEEDEEGEAHDGTPE